MAQAKRRRTWRSLTMLFGLLLAMPPTLASAAKPDTSTVVEVTDTERGRDFAHDAATYVSDKYGIDLPPQALAVWEVDGDLMAGPRGTTLKAQRQELDDGTINYTFEATEPRTSNSSEAEQLTQQEASALAGSWTTVGSYCWIDDHNQAGWMDVCYWKYKLSSDGDAGSDYFALNMFTTFAAPGWGMEIGDPWIQSNPSGTVTHNWADWDPGADTTRNCTTLITLTVTARGVPLQVSAQQCETWDITKYATAGQFRNKWTEGLCMMRQGETQLELEVISRVAQNKVPTWSFNWNESIQPAACSW